MHNDETKTDQARRANSVVASPSSSTASERGASHTKGPWKTLRGVDDDETRWVVVAAGAGREYVIATVENGQPGDSLETEAATASLIASAPTLLAAARLARDQMVQTIAPRQLFTDAVDQLDAAISEAEGR